MVAKKNFKKIFKNIAFAGLVLLSSVTNICLANNSPLGYWKTIDDVTGAEKSIILIEKNNKNVYSAKVVKILKLDEPGDPETKVCDKCSGSRHNQQIKGMTIMWGVTKDSDEDSWSGGKILDPKTGSVYKVTFELDKDSGGKNLNVRGYIGISLLGRTQVWHRTSWTENKTENTNTNSVNSAVQPKAENKNNNK